MKNIYNAALLALLVFGLSAFINANHKSYKKQDEKIMTLAEYNKRTANKDKMVLVYFSASWCAVCLKMKPVVENAENKFSKEIEVLRIDTDRDKEVSNEFEIDALPVLILYRNGVREWVYVGLIDNKALDAKIESYGYDISHSHE